MSPQLDALAMLNKLFESRDGLPVDSVTLTRHGYGILAEALMQTQTWQRAEALPMDSIEAKYEAAWEDSARWRWLFGDNGANIMVSVKLRAKRDGDMHDADTKKFGNLVMGTGHFPLKFFVIAIDALRLGATLQHAMDTAARKVVSDKHPDCEDRCQILEHKGYHTCSSTGRCEFLADEEYDCPIHGRLGGINYCPRC